MADQNVIIDPESLKLPATNPMRIDGGGPDFVGLFDDTTSWSGRKKFRNPTDFVSNPRLILQFRPMDTQVGTLTVKWSVYVMAKSPGSVIGADSFDTVNTGTKTLTLNEVQDTLNELEIALSNFDSGVGGDRLTLKISLDVSGTAAGQTGLETITYVYADA